MKSIEENIHTKAETVKRFINAVGSEIDINTKDVKYVEYLGELGAARLHYTAGDFVDVFMNDEQLKERFVCK